MTAAATESFVTTGVAGLDDVLHGGLTPHRIYLVEGTPGAGKTTLALHFLLSGVARGERGMYVTLSETPEELHAAARGHGWDLAGVEIVELQAADGGSPADPKYTMFHPAEVELAETTKLMLECADKIKPTRVVIDSLSEFRLLAQNPLRFRREVLALKQYFSRRRCTVLLADDRSAANGDADLFSIAHGVISLDRRATEYGSLRRQMQVVKLRGRPFREGWHDLRITTGGLRVFPRLVSAEHHADFVPDQVSSELPALDALMGGGLTRGTSTLIMGPAGAGKSSVAAQFVAAACRRGERVAAFLFEELLTTYIARSAGLGMELQQWIDNNTLVVRQVDPAELSPGEFAQAVRDAVEEGGVRMVVIDTLNGYLNAMPSEKLLMIHLHELLSYLGQRGVTTILVTAQHGLVGGNMGSPIDTSYLADAVVLLRFYEDRGRLCQAISVVKKRTGFHEHTIREMRLSSRGVEVGEPLRRLRGVLSGIPVPETGPLPESRNQVPESMGVPSAEDRLLVLAPTAEDAALSLDILGEAGIECTICGDAEDLAREMDEGAAAILLTEGVIAGGNPVNLIRTIRRQPEWSDIPVLLLAGGGADSPAATWLMESLGNVTMLERPVRIIILISAVRSAIKARRRQYQVREQLQTIRRAQEELQVDARRKDEFLATLAHELRNPLAPITNSLGLLQHELAGPEQRQYAIELIGRQVAHMVRLVDDLLDLSRITRGSVELRIEPVDIPAAVRAAVDAARPLIDANHHHLTVVLPPEHLEIEADAVRLTQILTNLLNNAAKYTAPGGSIELRCALTPVDAGECMEVTVTDTGAGIPLDMLHRVFDMFAQVDHTRKLAHGGLGIGLTLVKRLVELHGGSVEARSQGIGRGSRFVVRLPVRGPSEAAPSPCAAPEPAVTGGRQAVGVYGG